MFRFLVVLAVLMAVYAEMRVQMERDVKFDGVIPRFWLKESEAKDRIKVELLTISRAYALIYPFPYKLTSYQRRYLF